MPVVTIVCGGLLIALGLWGDWSKSITALIPAFFGAPLVLCGLIALKESLLKHAMHAAATIGLLGFLAGVGNLIRVEVQGGDLWDTKAVTTMKMTLVCGAFVALCINSFIQARRRRAAREAAQ